jgi:hypothetical protein
MLRTAWLRKRINTHRGGNERGGSAARVALAPRQLDRRRLAHLMQHRLP